MTQDVLRAILGDIPGATVNDDRFTFAEDQAVTFHLGEPGKTAAVREVQSGRLRGEFVAFTTAESEVTYFMPYESLAAVSVLPSRKQGRAGFA